MARRARGEDAPQPLVWGGLIADLSSRGISDRDIYNTLKSFGFPTMPPTKALRRGRPGPWYRGVIGEVKAAIVGRTDVATAPYYKRPPQSLYEPWLAVNRSIYWTEMAMVTFDPSADRFVTRTFHYFSREPHTVNTAGADIYRNWNERDREKGYGIEILYAMVPTFIGRGFRDEQSARRWVAQRNKRKGKT